MILKQEKINEGISFSSIKTDKFKSSVISFSLTFPMSKETVVYNLLLAQMLLRGTKNFPSLSLLNKHLDELYGSYIEIKSHNVGQNVSLAITAEALESKYIPDNTDILGDVIKIAAELILSPAFIQDNFNRAYFEQEKKLAIDAINSEINNTRVFAAKRCVELMGENSVKPTSEELKILFANADFEGLINHYRSIILNAPINIFYIGLEDNSTIKNKILAAFGTHAPKASFSLVSLRQIKSSSLCEKSIKMPVSQGKLSLGFSTDTVFDNSDKYYTMMMLNELLGGSASSKLFLNVREKMSLCYYCSSSYSPFSGVLLVSSGFEVKNHKIAKEAILEQLEDIKNGLISDTEFSAAQKSFINSYRQLYDSPFDIQAFISDRAMFGITDTLDTAQKKLLAVTKEDIISLASQIKLNASFFVEGTEDGEEEI